MHCSKNRMKRLKKDIEIDDEDIEEEIDDKKQMNRTNAVWKTHTAYYVIIEPEVDVNPPVQVH